MSLSLRVLVVFVVVLPGLGCRRTPVDHVKRAEAYVTQKRYGDAIIEYRAALEQDGQQGAATLALGDVYAQVGDGSNAFRQYIRAAELLPQNVDAHLKAGALLLMANRFGEAETQAEKALQVAPRHAGALILLGNALAGLKDDSGAVERLTQALDVDAGSGIAYSSLGALELTRGDQQRAEASFKKAVASNPSAVLPRVALAQFYRSQKRDADAEAALTDAVRIAPRDVQANMNLAALYIQTGRAAQAETAIKTIADVLQTPDSQFMLAEYYIRTNRVPQAVALLETLAGGSATYGLAKVRLAEIAFNQGRAAEAEKTLDEILAREPNNRGALLAKGRVLLLAKKYDAAMGFLKSAAAADPARAAEPTTLEADVYLSRGQLEEARDTYKQVLAVAPLSVRAQLSLSKLYAATGQTKSALDLAESVVQHDPNNSDAHLNLVRCLLASNDLISAEKEIRTLQDHFAPSAPALVETAALSLAQHNPEAATAALAKALAIDPSSGDALEALIALDLARKDQASARDRVDARLRQAPLDGRAWYLRAELDAALGDKKQTEEALRKTIELSPTNLQAFAMLGRLYGAQGRIAEARQQFETWAAREPRSVAAHTMVALLFEQEHQQTAAQKVYEKTLELDPHAAVAANNLAWMYAESGNRLDEALQLAQVAVSQAPDVPDFNDTLGWVYYERHLPAEALPLISRAEAADRKNPLFHYHLGMVYAKQGDSRAAESLKRALALSSNFPGAADAKRALDELTAQ